MLRSSLRRLAGLAGATALTAAAVAALSTPSYAVPGDYPVCRSTVADVEILKIDYAKGTATVKLKDSAVCEVAGITLVSYEAQSNKWETSRPQYLYDSQTQMVPRGQSLDYKIKVPDCFWQVDLVFGRTIDPLVEGGTTYSAEGRLIAGKLGGTKPCVKPTHTSTPRRRRRRSSRRTRRRRLTRRPRRTLRRRPRPRSPPRPRPRGRRTPVRRPDTDRDPDADRNSDDAGARADDDPGRHAAAHGCRRWSGGRPRWAAARRWRNPRLCGTAAFRELELRR